MASLNIYGKTIREYQGKGVVTLHSGVTGSCSLQTVQLADGKMVARCVFEEDLGVAHECFREYDSIASINGYSDQDGEFSLEGQLICINSNIRQTSDGQTIEMIVVVGAVAACKHEAGTPRVARFGITNFEFLGNKVTHFPRGGGARNILSLCLNGVPLEIHWIKDHTAIMKSVRVQKGIDVTCEAIVDVHSEDDLGSVVKLVDTLCRLLSFARGTKVNWVYYDCLDADGERISSYHRNSIVWQYADLPVIDPHNPSETASFVEQAYTSYLDQKDVHGLDVAIEAYLDAKRESVYLDTRALRAAVVLELLVSRYSARKGIGTIVKSSHFKKISHNVKCILVKYFNENALPEDNLLETQSKIPELNRPRFGTMLRTMLDELGVAIAQRNLDRLVKIRNSLVHDGTFLTEETWQEYALLISTLDSIFMKILDYDGPHLDFANGFTRVEVDGS